MGIEVLTVGISMHYLSCLRRRTGRTVLCRRFGASMQSLLILASACLSGLRVRSAVSLRSASVYSSSAPAASANLGSRAFCVAITEGNQRGMRSSGSFPLRREESHNLSEETDLEARRISFLL